MRRAVCLEHVVRHAKSCKDESPRRLATAPGTVRGPELARSLLNNVRTRRNTVPLTPPPMIPSPIRPSVLTVKSVEADVGSGPASVVKRIACNRTFSRNCHAFDDSVKATHSER